MKRLGRAGTGPKRHRWRKLDEDHASRCVDCGAEVRRRPAWAPDGVESTRWLSDWSWQKDSRFPLYRRTGGSTPPCPPSPADFLADHGDQDDRGVE